MYVPSKSSKTRPPKPKILKQTQQPRKLAKRRKPAIKKIGASVMGVSYWTPTSNWTMKPAKKIERRPGASLKREIRATKSKGT